MLHNFRLNWRVFTRPLADPFPRALSPVPGPFGWTWPSLWPSAFCQHMAFGLCVPAPHRATWGRAGPLCAGVPSAESRPASMWPGLKWEATGWTGAVWTETWLWQLLRGWVAWRVARQEETSRAGGGGRWKTPEVSAGDPNCSPTP